MILILFTNSYPYDFSTERTFLAREIPYLTTTIERIIIVPKLVRGNLLSYPSNVEIDEGFSVFYKKNIRFFLRLFLRTIRSPYFYNEIITKPSLLIKPIKLAKLILFLGRAEITKTWTIARIDTLEKKDKKIVLYSYWFDDISMGLSLVKQEKPSIRLISRAHGYDIYEELYFPYYWPLRRDNLNALDKLFLASEDGREYFRKRYPEYQEIFETAHLGVDDPGFLSNASNDGVLRIVSCAHIVALKRIGLLLEAIALAAKLRPEQRFEWYHFGDGKERSKLQQKITRLFPPNAEGIMPGFVPNANVMLHYKTKPVDVFVNLSTTEGGAPVSIQEAISCGIPVIATNVGGNPEIVSSERNGILLDPNPTPGEVAQALLTICDNPNKVLQMREESRRLWEREYNAKNNFYTFANRLRKIGYSE